MSEAFTQRERVEGARHSPLIELAGPAEVRAINQKLRKAIETEGRCGLVEGLWWQLSLTMRSEDDPTAVGLLDIARDRDGLNLTGRAWQGDGTVSARYWSEAAKERRDPAGILYFWKGERPRHPNAPQLEGTGEIRLETADRATGYWMTRSDRDRGLNARTAGVYLRADSSDLQVLDDGSEEERAQLIAQRLQEWKSAASTFWVPSGYLRSSAEGSEIASTSSPVFCSFSLRVRAMSAWATMPTSLPFSTTGSRRTWWRAMSWSASSRSLSGSTLMRSREDTSPTDVVFGSAASATTLVVMSRSVIIPISCSSSVIGSEPMCFSRISCAASTTDADAPIERGSAVIASRTLFAIVPPSRL